MGKSNVRPGILAIIPARGGSRGIPRKNVRPLCGKPLIAYTIEAALSSKLIDRVVVSSEDEEIATISSQYGAEVIERPPELATDNSPTEPVLEHTVGYLQQTQDYKADIVILLQPTSPLRNHRHIDEALGSFLSNEYDSLLSVCRSHLFLWRMGRDGAYPLNFDFRDRPRRQDKELEYQENGAIFVTRLEILLQGHNRLGGKVGLYVMPREESCEIDSEFDLWSCEEYIRMERRKVP